MRDFLKRSLQSAAAVMLFLMLAATGAAAAEAVTGLNVRTVTYPGGTLTNVSGKTWVEQNKDGQFQFEEMVRDPLTVSMIDHGRGMALMIDLHRKQVMFAPSGKEWAPLYTISTATTTSDGVVSQDAATLPPPKSNGTDVATTLPLPKPGTSGDGGAGFVWSYYKSFDGSGTLITLGYGIPETDAQQLQATCVVGAGGPFAMIQIGADVGTLKEDANVKVQFSGGTFNGTYGASVVGTQAEEGITGASIPMELDDSFWQAMIKQSKFTYKVVGHGAMQLSLGGAKGPVSKFVQECQNIPDTGVAQNNDSDDTAMTETEDDTGQDEVGAGKTLACEVFPGIKSPAGDGGASVTFTNDTDMMRSVMWIDGNGQPQQHFNLDPGQSQTQGTSPGAVWMMTDGPGNCAELYVAPGGKSTFHITAEVNDGGD